MSVRRDGLQATPCRVGYTEGCSTMPFARSAGLLLHPTSLPGPGGVGTLGPAAFIFADTLAAAGMAIWQVLPLGPTGYGDSPYAALSAFAGNPLLIAFEPLIEAGLLELRDLEAIPLTSSAAVDFGTVIPARTAILRTAFDRHRIALTSTAGFRRFCRANQEWLDDFALYLAIKGEHGGAAWIEWEPALRDRTGDALDRARERLEAELAFQCWVQQLFFGQWNRLKSYVHRRGISIVGDMPIFVAHDSADVWANRELFELDAHGVPEVVAGVPPDYFSASGQLWGNPHYRWSVMAGQGFAWWIARFRALLRLVDIVRLDHFRGFAAGWAVPYGQTTAAHGRWVAAPGAELFTAVNAALGPVPVIAEDLGVITPDVDELRRAFGFPGMKVLQFAFSTDASDPSLPHNFHPDTVVYTGTHDNDTTLGWFESISRQERRRVRRYAGTQGLDVGWDLIRLALASVAELAVVPLQDVLRLGTKARMNMPGRPDGNWTWRFVDGDFTPAHVHGLRFLAETYGRTGRVRPKRV